MAQYLYIFNALPAQIRLVLEPEQGQPLTTPVIAATSSTSSPPYEPGGIQVQRSDSASPATLAFINGVDNLVRVQKIQSQSSNAGSLPIPLAASSTPNLFLYVFTTFMLLLSGDGVVLANESIDWGSGDDVASGQIQEFIQ
jgi:hypothetical protein